MLQPIESSCYSVFESQPHHSFVLLSGFPRHTDHDSAMSWAICNGEALTKVAKGGLRHRFRACNLQAPLLSQLPPTLRVLGSLFRPPEPSSARGDCKRSNSVHSRLQQPVWRPSLFLVLACQLKRSLPLSGLCQGLHTGLPVTGADNCCSCTKALQMLDLCRDLLISH